MIFASFCEIAGIKHLFFQMSVNKRLTDVMTAHKAEVELEERALSMRNYTRITNDLGFKCASIFVQKLQTDQNHNPP